MLYKLFGALVTGGQMYVDRAWMDFTLEDLSADKLEAIVNEANRLMAEGAPVEVSGLPPGVKEVPVVNAVGIDQQPGGGTHVGNTREVGRVNILETKNTGRISQRLEIALEA